MLFHRTIEDLGSFLLNQDVIRVVGGNTANMLAIWRLHGVYRVEMNDGEVRETAVDPEAIW